MRFFCSFLILILTLKGYGQDLESIKIAKTQEIRALLLPLLEEHCPKNCELLDLSLSVKQEFNYQNEPLGFEDVSPTPPPEPTYRGKLLKVRIQIDQDIPKEEKDRLDILLRNHLTPKAESLDLQWVTLDLPEIEASHLPFEDQKADLRQVILSELQKVIDRYCPETCLISNVAIKARPATGQEVRSGQKLRFFYPDESRTPLVIEDMVIEGAIDQKLDLTSRSQITKMMKQVTKSYEPVDYQIEVIEFPESFEKRAQRLAKAQDDPYGLDKLRQMLTLFRDLAGTKEIVTQTSESKTESNKQSTSTDSKEKSTGEDETTGRWVLYLMSFLMIFGLMIFAFLRYSQAKKDTQVLSMGFTSPAAGRSGRSTEDKKSPPKDTEEYLRRRVEKDRMKSDLRELFISDPKTAKETFARFLEDQNFSDLAKAVHLFGKLVVHELLQDPSYQKPMDDLTQYYEGTNFDLSLEEEIDLCKKLKKSMTAQEIKRLTYPGHERFQFLDSLTAQDLLSLIEDESPLVQTVVLTHLKEYKQKEFFSLLERQKKKKLLQELLSSPRIPGEEMVRITQNLKQKIAQNPYFKKESLGSADLALSLLEKAPPGDQKELILALGQNHPVEARLLKSRLVTIEGLAYLTDKILLQIILDLKQEDLIAFLGRCSKNILKAILGKAPPELSKVWSEELSYKESHDPSGYAAVESEIIKKMRDLAAQGAIDLVQINDQVFSS